MDIKLIGAACSLGGKHPGTRDGPEYFKNHALSTLQQQMSAPQGNKLQFEWVKTILESQSKASDSTQYLNVIENYCRQIRDETADVLKHKDFPLVIGGDHSCAIGTWSGVSQVIEKPIGMLWIDAHLDAHTPETSPSGSVHGMPVACLLGYGPKALVDLLPHGPAFDPKHTCIVGARSFESEEPEFLTQEGVKVFYMKEIERDGFDAVFNQALQHVMKATHGFGISIDLDAIDPKDAPGVTTFEEGGFSGADLVNSLEKIKKIDSLIALEIAEFNPAHDKQNRTCDLTRELIKAVFDS